MWSNCKNRVKEAVSKNEDLTDDEKHYIRYILKSDLIFQKILQKKSFVPTDKMKTLVIREKYIHNLITFILLLHYLHQNMFSIYQLFHHLY